MENACPDCFLRNPSERVSTCFYAKAKKSIYRHFREALFPQDKHVFTKFRVKIRSGPAATANGRRRPGINEL